MCVDPQTILLVTNIPNKCSKRVCERTLLSFVRLNIISMFLFQVMKRTLAATVREPKTRVVRFKKSEGFSAGCH